MNGIPVVADSSPGVRLVLHKEQGQLRPRPFCEWAENGLIETLI
jgi:hypothetical protein